MGMIRVEKFLCFSLETGGLVIGWFTLILNALFGVLYVAALIFLAIENCHDLEELMKKYVQVLDEKSCEVLRIALIVILVIAIGLNIAFAVIGRSCISGTKKRNHNQIKPLVVLLALSSICAFLNVLKFTPYGISSGLIYGFIYGYLFVCVYSLFYKIRAEFDGGLEYQPINP